MSSLDDLIDLNEIVKKLKKEDPTSQNIDEQKFCISQIKPLYYNNGENCMTCESCTTTPDREQLQYIYNWHAFLKDPQRPDSIFCKTCLTELVTIKPATFCTTCSQIIFHKGEKYVVHSCTYLTQTWEKEPFFPLLFFQEQRNCQAKPTSLWTTNLTL